jgi:cellulose synthase/poly-beta-1,6-N-acetylglucosamine synthase-like glycosyltransferase
MRTPVISGVIPMYNHGEFVLGALETALAQSFVDYEVIVLNDGSPNHTAGLRRSPAETGRIRGSPGEYIAVLGDDPLPANKPEWQEECLATSAPAVGMRGERADSAQGSRLFRTVGPFAVIEPRSFFSGDPSESAGRVLLLGFAPGWRTPKYWARASMNPPLPGRSVGRAGVPTATRETDPPGHTTGPRSLAGR